jgi:BirA family biotin operon repressor/biotin-[acetyl-CoA-carboxylase] ligase
VVAALISEMYGVDARLKWPNDVLVGGKKVAGMLSEMAAEADRVLYVNIGVGVGINMNNDVSRVGAPAVSVKALLGKPVRRSGFLARFLDVFESQVEKEDFSEVLTRWKEKTDTLSRPVRIITLRETIEGVAEDLDQNGALVIRQKNGVARRIVHGDCFHG